MTLKLFRREVESWKKVEYLRAVIGRWRLAHPEYRTVIMRGEKLLAWRNEGAPCEEFLLSDVVREQEE